ncbi:MAG: hypothetical protein MUF66_02165 [Gammaproteobacteria bacterium]|jgi:hypothetical protein|nr:hypothetical protein [Gammaproteobacteria bacterium]
MKKTAAVGMLLAASILLPGTAVRAATLYGDSVSFTLDDSLLGLFGGVSVTGNTLRFDPTAFHATGIPNGLVVTRATTPTISVTALDPDGSGPRHTSLTSVSLFEQGNYFRIAATEQATVVGAGGQLTVNGANYAVSAGGLASFQTVADVINDGILTTPWTLSAIVPVSGDEATVKVQNILIAGITGGLEAAYIEKKLVEIRIDAETTVVPIPASVWLLGSALFGVGILGRRMRGLRAA